VYRTPNILFIGFFADNWWNVALKWAKFIDKLNELKEIKKLRTEVYKNFSTFNKDLKNGEYH